MTRRFISSLALAPSGLARPTGDYGKRAGFWSTAIGEMGHDLGGHEDAVTGVAWSGDGALFATASRDGTVRIWEAIAQRRQS